MSAESPPAGRALASFASATLALMAAACASKPPPAFEGRPLATSADLHRIAIQSVEERLDLPVPVGASGFDEPSLRAVDEFGSLYEARGSGPIAIEIPRGSANADDARRLADAAADRLAAAGAPTAAISLAYYDGSGLSDAPLLLRFSRFSATPPDCPSVGEASLSKTASNTPWPSFGCAGAANLAAMIAEPGDLVSPQTMTPADAQRRQEVLEKYRSGGQTHATRSSDERVTISDAVR